MIIKARRNLLVCSCDPFDDVYINPCGILSVERYEGDHDGKAIIRLKSEISYITESSFEEILQMLKEEGVMS